MAKSKKPTFRVGKLTGRTVAFFGRFGNGGRDLDAMRSLVAAEGGSVVEGEKSPPASRAAGAVAGTNPPAAIAKIQKKHPHLQPIDEASFYQLVNPTAEEFLEIVLSGLHE